MSVGRTAALVIGTALAAVGIGVACYQRGRTVQQRVDIEEMKKAVEMFGGIVGEMTMRAELAEGQATDMFRKAQRMIDEAYEVNGKPRPSHLSLIPGGKPN